MDKMDLCGEGDACMGWELDISLAWSTAWGRNDAI